MNIISNQHLVTSEWKYEWKMRIQSLKSSTKHRISKLLLLDIHINLELWYNDYLYSIQKVIMSFSGIATTGPPKVTPFPTSGSAVLPVEEALLLEAGIQEEEDETLMLEAASQEEKKEALNEEAIMAEEAIVARYALQAEQAARAKERAAQNKQAAQALRAAKELEKQKIQ